MHHIFAENKICYAKFYDNIGFHAYRTACHIRTEPSGN